MGQGVGYTEGYMGDSTLSVRLDFLKKKKKKEISEMNNASSSAELGSLRTFFFF